MNGAIGPVRGVTKILPANAAKFSGGAWGAQTNIQPPVPINWSVKSYNCRRSDVTERKICFSAPILQRDLSLFKGYGHQFDFDACMRCRSAKYIYCQSFRPAVSDLRKWGKTAIVSDPYTLGHLSLALSLT